MNPLDKISPAFEPYLANSHRLDRQEAVVIYRAPPIKRPPTRSSRGRATRRRYQAVVQAEAHRDIETRILRSYLDNVDENVQVDTIGESALPAVTVEVTQHSLEELAKQPDVLAILPNQRIHLIRPQAIQYDSLAKQEIRSKMTWGLEQLEVQKLWHKTMGEGINVGVLDTGAFGEHPLLEHRIAEFVMIDPLGRRIAASPMFDANGHGTHVAGTIAGGQTPDGIAVGVAPKAKIHMGAVLVGDTTLRTLLEGIDWCVQMGSDILNLSLGFNYYEPHFTQVFDVLIDQYEMLPVVAIGNENQGNSSSPGNAYNALGVGAVETMGRSRLEVSFYSSGASLVFPDLAPGTIITKPDIVAPGSQVYSAIPPVLRSDGAYLYAYMDGTSMATPHVSGVAALLMAANPKASIRDIAQAIKETALHPAGDDHRPDNRWGYGLIQAEQAMLALA
ncbi:MAG: S8 family serine peptidase [Caldilineaceae bacterium]